MVGVLSGEVCVSNMCKFLLSSVGSEKNKWLTTQLSDQYALIVIVNDKSSGFY